MDALTSSSTAGLSECFLCSDSIVIEDSKLLECCQQTIHQNCFLNYLAEEYQKCLFCTAEITDIPLQTKVHGLMLRTFQKGKREEHGSLSAVVRAMYNPYELPISFNQQMEAPLAHKRRLCAEFVEQIKNPASQVLPGSTKHSLELDFLFYMQDIRDEIAIFLEEAPFIVSRDILKGMAQALLQEESLTHSEKKSGWDRYFQNSLTDPQNRGVID